MRQNNKLIRTYLFIVNLVCVLIQFVLYFYIVIYSLYKATQKPQKYMDITLSRAHQKTTKTAGHFILVQ